MAATNARERVIADSQFGSGSTTYSPATWYLGLSTTVPSDDGSNFTEPSGGSYARVSVTNNNTNFPAASTSGGVTTKTSGADFTFPDPTGSWGLIVYGGWFTASSGGTPEFVFPLDSAITVNNGNSPVQFLASTLVMVWE